MEIAGYIASVFIGITLGLIGGGGSILTVPVLVYLFGIDAVLATAYSLFIVGATSAVGTFRFYKKGLVQVKTAFIFGIPSIAAVYLTRAFIVPAIPDYIFQIGAFVLTKSILLLILFAVLMILASVSMIRKKSNSEEDEPLHSIPYVAIVFQGIIIGIITALVGAGGGFLIIPVLVHFLKLSMKMAVGTSLMIITLNSLLGFAFSLPYILVQWKIVLSVATIAVIGIIIGTYISSFIDGKKLKPAFGWFVLIMGLYILIKEIFY